MTKAMVAFLAGIEEKIRSLPLLIRTLPRRRFFEADCDQIKHCSRDGM